MNAEGRRWDHLRVERRRGSGPRRAVRPAGTVGGDDAWLLSTFPADVPADLPIEPGADATATGPLNTWIKEVVAANPPPVRGGKQPRILFATQATARPPTFVLFTSGFLEAGYRRFLERRLRETFGFEGSPIRINVRVREKRGPKPRR